MAPVATLVGHTYRVLFLAMSPDGQTIVTGSGDETLRFWNAFQQPKIGGGNLTSPDKDGIAGSSTGRGDSALNPFSKIR